MEFMIENTYVFSLYTANICVCELWVECVCVCVFVGAMVHLHYIHFFNHMKIISFWMKSYTDK